MLYRYLNSGFIELSDKIKVLFLCYFYIYFFTFYLIVFHCNYYVFIFGKKEGTKPTTTTTTLRSSNRNMVNAMKRITALCLNG